MKPLVYQGPGQKAPLDLNGGNGVDRVPWFNWCRRSAIHAKETVVDESDT